MPQLKWPWPGDSREDKAKRVALSYRRIMQNVAQHRCDDPAGELHRLDQHWKQLGVHWHIPNNIPLDPETWLTAPELAHAIGRTTRDIYNWARRGHIETRQGPGRTEYSAQSVLEYQRRKNQR